MNRAKNIVRAVIATGLAGTIAVALTLGGPVSPAAKRYFHAALAEVTGPDPMTFGMRVGPAAGPLPPPAHR